jgi:hypothetical protein
MLLASDSANPNRKLLHHCPAGGPRGRSTGGHGHLRKMDVCGDSRDDDADDREPPSTILRAAVPCVPACKPSLITAAGCTTIREIGRQLDTYSAVSPTGPTWDQSTIGRLLWQPGPHRPGLLQPHGMIAASGLGRRTRQVPRPRVDRSRSPARPSSPTSSPRAACRVACDNTQSSPRRVEPGAFLLKGLVKCRDYWLFGSERG